MALRETQILKTLFDSLTVEVDKKKIIKQGFEPNTILFDLFSLNNNRKSKIFQNSSDLFLPDSIENLIEKRLVQKLDVNGIIKYTLSFRGLSESLEIFHGYKKVEQFTNFLELNDQSYMKKTVTGELNWREKLALTTLLYLGCVSIKSAMNLNNTLNRKTFETLLETNITILTKHGIFEAKHELPQTRGEPRSALFMRSRINELARKSNHIYQNKGRGEGYYLDIVNDDIIDPEKTNYILRKIIQKYDPNINYTNLNNELVENARSYQSRFLSVNFNSGVLLNLLDTINNFYNRTIWEIT